MYLSETQASSPSIPVPDPCQHRPVPRCISPAASPGVTPRVPPHSFPKPESPFWTCLHTPPIPSPPFSQPSFHWSDIHHDRSAFCMSCYVYRYAHINACKVSPTATLSVFSAGRASAVTVGGGGAFSSLRPMILCFLLSISFPLRVSLKAALAVDT